MNTRLKQFLAAENISQSQFADTIKVVRASVSHVLAGRNNPSYDFIKAIMDNYPSLNIEWLILGKGKMYKDSPNPMPMPAPAPIQPTLDEEPNLFTYEEDDVPPVIDTKIQSSDEITTTNNTTQTNIKQRVVAKIIILYDDGTYQEM